MNEVNECSEFSKKRLPSEICVLCGKSLDEVGGYRIIAQKLRGSTLSEKYRGGGDRDFPYRSFKLYNGSDVYVVIWGEKEKWTESVIEKVIDEYRKGNRPWFCQICGKRRCSKCGSPINYPMGSDVLYNDGCSSHAPILPIDPGCTNPHCEKFREWKWDVT